MSLTTGAPFLHISPIQELQFQVRAGQALSRYWVTSILILTNQVRLFADDCLVYTPVDGETERESVQKDLQTLESWQERWKTSFNRTKCFSMEISPKKEEKKSPAAC